MSFLGGLFLGGIVGACVVGAMCRSSMRKQVRFLRGVDAALAAQIVKDREQMRSVRGLS